ncbi:hypothetical protein BDW02DRAFT_504857 [Decorospora gaudefroyi]|uniref:CHAT domain-containing protein n=1 Tax=Decorospora gaudefroyi TaxID=184978 RepID=A0A6A5KDZ6_9PLEO|nr:hypothetical protein BDW02DRAFT_504857 [Decorospora gaudefroyi]
MVTTKKGTSVKHLPSFNDKSCKEYYAKFKHFLKIRNDNLDEARVALEDVLGWLWRVAAEPVLEIIRKDLVPQDSFKGTLPRVWWISCGWINVFPIHIAGNYSKRPDGTTGHTVMDHVISSYTPSLKALDYARKTMERMTAACSGYPERPSALLVSMKYTPDIKPDLGNAPIEIRDVKGILESAYKVIALGNPREEFADKPSKKSVVTALHSCTIAHFACHGIADENDPLKSKLILCDWIERPLRVGLLMRMDLERCQLVNLSACDMAVNRDLLLREEGLHVAGAFQLAGVPNTIATMWPIIDAYAARVSSGLYTALASGKNACSFSASAVELHFVLKKMSNEGLSPVIWGPYVHFGA